MSQLEFDNIEKFKANVELRDKHNKKFLNNEIVNILHTTEKTTLLEIDDKQYNVIGNIRDVVKTEFIVEDYIQAVITFVFLAIGVLAYSQISLILNLSLEFNITYVVVIISLSISATVFFLGTRKFTRQFICLVLVKTKGEKEFWVAF